MIKCGNLPCHIPTFPQLTTFLLPQLQLVRMPTFPRVLFDNPKIGPPCLSCGFYVLMERAMAITIATAERGFSRPEKVETCDPHSKFNMSCGCSALWSVKTTVSGEIGVAAFIFLAPLPTTLIHTHTHITHTHQAQWQFLSPKVTDQLQQISC